jgi:hypothetical protein
MTWFSGARRRVVLGYAPSSIALESIAVGAPASVRDVFDRVLHDSQRRNYQFTGTLREVLEQFVDALRFAGETCDAVIAEVDRAIRLVQPAFRFPADDAWKTSWDAYFHLYDRLIQSAVIAYFVDATDRQRST